MKAGAYALHAHDAFRAWFASELRDLGARLEHDIPGCVAVILGGGYGRGDGGVRPLPHDDPSGARSGGMAPYNDLDVFVVVRRSDLARATRETVRQAIDATREEFAERLGIAVDVGQPIADASLAFLPPQLMWFDLVNGHEVIAGDRGILLEEASHLLSDRCAVPEIEGQKLLINRGVGLLLAHLVRLGKTPPIHEPIDADFVQRNIMKAYLAMCDATLIRSGAYVSQSVGKLEALHALVRENELSTELIAGIERAVQFKQQPGTVADAPRYQTQDIQMAAGHWTATYQPGAPPPRPRGRGRTAAFEPAMNTWKRLPANCAHNLRLGRIAVRYPREVLFQQIPVLLAQLATDGQITRLAQGPPRFRTMGALLKLWERYN